MLLKSNKTYKNRGLASKNEALKPQDIWRALMAEFIYLNRDTRFFVQLGANLWEVPILEDYGFTQATEASEVTLAEAEDSTGQSVRGRATFNDALNPAEWNINAYIRPYEDTTHFLADGVLWASLMGADTYTEPDFFRGTGIVADSSNDHVHFTFNQSNRSQQPEGLTLYFVLGTGTGERARVLRLNRASVNEASLTFDLEGIATVAWSGFAAQMTDVTEDIQLVTLGSNPTSTIAAESIVRTADGTLRYVAAEIDSTNVTGRNAVIINNAKNRMSPTFTTSNLIANRLTQLIVKPDKTASGQSGLQDEYQMALTGGTITINNNVTFLTPEELGKVNLPLRNVTGARSVSGDFTCYLRYDDTEDTRSHSFWNDLASLTNVTRNAFRVAFNVGGSAPVVQSGGNTGTGLLNITGSRPTAQYNPIDPTETNPSEDDYDRNADNVPAPSGPSGAVQFFFPNVNFEIPSHTVEDVISLSATFNALPSELTETDEVYITAVGA